MHTIPLNHLEAQIVASQRRFRILAPEGMLSGDTFFLPPRQPPNLKAGCTMLIHERSGTLLTVRDTRLFPAEAAGALPVADAPKGACLKCGRGQGVLEDLARCPDHDGGSCGMREPNYPPQ
jgi:hypothetical protein